MHNHPQVSINKSNFGRLFSVSRSIGATVYIALKAFQCVALYPYNLSVLSDGKFLPQFIRRRTIQNMRPVFHQ
jgi:hypothetical protein